MATNEIFESARILSLVVTNPTTPVSGGPVRFGLRIGVALTDERADGTTTVKFDGVFDLSVAAVDGSGNSAVAVGDAIFFVDADTPKLSKKSSGYFAGFALEAISSGATDTIRVALGDSPGSGTLAAGAVGTTQLAAAGVTVAKLSTAQQTGFIPLPLTGFRLIATNDIAAKNAADGGLISLDTDPTLKRVNGATDKQLRIAWAAASVVEITTQFAYPHDLDDAGTIVVHLLAGMGGATDTPVIAVSFWEGVGDTNAGGNSAALAATVADKSVTIAAADVGAYPKAATIGLTPGTHANDAVYIYAAWITYTRKD